MPLVSADQAIIGIIGAGGHGRDSLPMIRNNAAALASTGVDVRLVFVEEQPRANVVNGTAVMSFDDFCATPGRKLFNVAIADSIHRERLAVAAMEQGADPMALIGGSVMIGDETTIGAGVMLSENSMVMANDTVGRFFHLNVFAYVGHDCVVGDFVTFGPSVKCGGRVHFGDHTYVGAGAMIREGSSSEPLRIGRGAVVGMGAVVLNDVPPFAVVAGNPAKVIKMRDEF